MSERSATPPDRARSREATPDRPVLEVRDLVKDFGGVRALDSVSLTANGGEVTALVGENGAGKSTLIKCITGIHAPDRGEIRLDDEPVAWDGPFAARAAGVEAVYQDLALAENLDVAGNIFLGREERHGWSRAFMLRKRAMRTRAGEMLEEFGINVPSPRVEVGNLSGGQRQGVSIARATAWGARLVIMDEPTAALGVRESERVLELITELARRRLPVILISHNLEDVFAVSDRIWILRRGQLVASLRTSETSHEEVVSHITGLSASGLAQRGWAPE